MGIAFKIVFKRAIAAPAPRHGREIVLIGLIDIVLYVAPETILAKALRRRNLRQGVVQSLYQGIQQGMQNPFNF